MRSARFAATALGCRRPNDKLCCGRSNNLRRRGRRMPAVPPSGGPAAASEARPSAPTAVRPARTRRMLWTVRRTRQRLRMSAPRIARSAQHLPRGPRCTRSRADTADVAVLQSVEDVLRHRHQAAATFSDLRALPSIGSTVRAARSRCVPGQPATSSRAGTSMRHHDREASTGRTVG